MIIAKSIIYPVMICGTAVVLDGTTMLPLAGVLSCFAVLVMLAYRWSKMEGDMRQTLKATEEVIKGLRNLSDRVLVLETEHRELKCKAQKKV